MTRYSKFLAVIWIAVSTSLSIAPSSSAVAADKSFNLLHRLAQLRDRAQVTQQAVAGIHRPGDAVVTGFSGVRPPQQIAPGIDPLDKTFIDLDGPSVRVIDLSNPGAPAQGQVMAAPKPFTVSARQIGQVFAVAQDDSTPPNIYVAATSAYGLPIVAGEPDRDGTPRRLRRGEPGARFMPGLFGPQDVGGGPGSIWKIDGRSGAVSLFANIPNSGAGLGDIVFDAAHQQLFVSDRATGLIHGIGLDGVARGTFDHGIAGRAAVGLVPVPDRPELRLNLQRPSFDPGNPQSWNLPAPARRTFGLAVFHNRLFYAVAEGPQIWSVALTPDGGFAANATWELGVPPSPRPSEIASILFDDDGQIYLAERGASTGAYDFKALASPGEAKVLRYRLRQPDDPPGPGRWAPVPDEYAVGFRPQYRNTNGGLALGYRYNERYTFGGCGGTLWTTGEQLRAPADPALARQLAASGLLDISGVQGVALDLLRPRNVPPLASLFAGYDERVPPPAAREQFGHMGDIAIWQSCGAPPPRLSLSCPFGFFWNGFAQFCEMPVVAGFACAPGLRWDDRACVAIICRAGQHWDGRRCVCPPNTEWNGRRCVPPRRECPEGQTWDGQRCVPPPQRLCPIGQTWDGQRCVPSPRCPPGQSWDGQACVCPPGQEGTGGACKCPPGEYWNGASCELSNGIGPTPPPGADCPPGQVCVPPGQPGDQAPPVTGDCSPVDQLRGLCVPPPPAQPPGNGTLLPNPPSDGGTVPRNPPSDGGTVPRCPAGQTWVGSTCAYVDPAHPSPGGGTVPANPPSGGGGTVPANPPSAGGQPNLTIQKTAIGTCSAGGDCTFQVTITNTGTAPTTGPVSIRDGNIAAPGSNVTPGIPAGSGVTMSAPGNCTANSVQGFDYTCTTAPIPPGGTVTLTFTIHVDSNSDLKQFQNCAQITVPATNPPQEACATHTLARQLPPAPMFPEVPEVRNEKPKTQIPIRSIGPPPSGLTCPSNQVWTGVNCSCPNEQRWDGSFCQSAPTCPEGQSYQGDRCAPACSGGQVWGGEFCTCPFGSTWNGTSCKNPVAQPHCDEGTRWDGERCAPVAKVPRCRRGTRWDGERCRPISKPTSIPRSTPEAVPGFEIQIGPGFGGGGGGRGFRGPGRGVGGPGRVPRGPGGGSFKPPSHSVPN